MMKTKRNTLILTSIIMLIPLVIGAVLMVFSVYMLKLLYRHKKKC